MSGWPEIMKSEINILNLMKWDAMNAREKST